MNHLHRPPALGPLPITLTQLARLVRIDGADPHFEVIWTEQRELRVERFETITLAGGYIQQLSEDGWLGSEHATKYPR